MAAFASLEDLLGTLRRYLWNSLLRVPWLCFYSTAGAALLVFLFAFNDQGQDLLRISAELGFTRRGLLWNGLFLLGTGLLSYSLWHSSRLLLGRDFPTYPLDAQAAAPGRKWLPRVLGAVVPLAIGASFLRIESGTGFARSGLGVLFIALGLGLLAFYVLRRRLPGVDPRLMLEVRPDFLPRAHRRAMTAAIAGSFVLLVAFVLFPVWLPQAIGAPAIAVLGVAGIALFGSMVLTYLFLARGAPAATTLALAVAVLCGFVNDNHGVRLADEVPALARLAPAEHYARWRQHHPPPPGAGSEPVVLVAASGGGIRAAYWTATVLAHMEGIAGFSDNLFAISGVSGGSLGAATYVTLKRRQAGGSGAANLRGATREVLAGDFLSPVVAGMLFPDLVQRFLPVPIPWADRQRFLERSWERAFGDAREVAGAFNALYAGEAQFRLPSLLLNATVVETGQRAVVSNLSVEGFSDTLDLLRPDLASRDLRLSAAVGLSARFTYVSPAGTVAREAGGVLRVVDGGYFENSGAASIADLLSLLPQSGKTCVPILVLIRNDPDAPAVCQGTGGRLDPAGRDAPPGGGFNATVSDMLAPMQTLLHTRQARGRLAEVEAARAVEALGGVVVEVPLAAVTEHALTAARGAQQRARVQARMIEPPLGWSLSEEVRAAMDTVLEQQAGGLRAQFSLLKAALAGPIDPRRRCHARQEGRGERG